MSSSALCESVIAGWEGVSIMLAQRGTGVPWGSPMRNQRVSLSVRSVTGPLGGQNSQMRLPWTLIDIERRKSELEMNPTQASESEIASLKALENKLKEAQQVYQRMPINFGGAEQAQRMRAMRDQLTKMAKESEGYVAVFNAVCQSERQILVQLAMQEQNGKNRRSCRRRKSSSD